MLLLPHALAGAAIGRHSVSFTKSAVIVFFLGLLSHYLLDAVPHWDVVIGREWYMNTGEYYSWRTYLQVLLDAGLAIVILFLTIRKHRQNLPLVAKLMMWGAIGAVTPDLLDNVPLLQDITGQIPILSHEREVHLWAHVSASEQMSLPPYFGLLTQLLIIVLGLYLVL